MISVMVKLEYIITLAVIIKSIGKTERMSMAMHLFRLLKAASAQKISDLITGGEIMWVKISIIYNRALCEVFSVHT